MRGRLQQRALPVSPTCHPNGQGSVRCLAFRHTDPAFEPSLYQGQLPPSGNAIFQGRDKGPETVPAIQSADCRDKMRAQIAANSGRFALNWEISVCAGLRGGAGRTRTSNQTIISSWLAKCLKCRGLCVRALCLPNQSPKELVSVSGKRIFAGRDKRARMAPKINFAFERDKSRARNAAISGHSATNGEISVRARLYGGTGRTRTSNQTIISSCLAKCPKCRGLRRALCLRLPQN